MMGQEFSGILRERISIERQAVGRDALGSAEPQYITVGVFWAAAEAMQTGVASEAGSRSALPRWRFSLRETQVIKPGDRLVWGNRIMTISSVILEHRRTRKTILQAEEKR